MMAAARQRAASLVCVAALLLCGCGKSVGSLESSPPAVREGSATTTTATSSAPRTASETSETESDPRETEQPPTEPGTTAVSLETAPDVTKLPEATEPTEATTGEPPLPPTETTAPAALPAERDIGSALEACFAPVAAQGGSYSLLAVPMDGGENIRIGRTGPMVSASLIKLYVAAATYEDDSSVRQQESYAGETDHLIEIMISQSDNAACNTLVTRLGDGDPSAGMARVNDFCAAHGFGDTQMNRLMLDWNGLENYTSAADCCKILGCFERDEFAGSQSIIKYMKAQVNRTKLPAGITDGTAVANKTGELSSVENDTAVVYAASGTYLVGVMTNGLSDTYTARSCISQAASVLHGYMTYGSGRENRT